MNFKLDYGVIMSQAQIKLRKYLNADALFKLVHPGFKKIKDHRSRDVDIFFDRRTYVIICPVCT